MNLIKGICFKFYSGVDKHGNSVPLYKVIQEGSGLSVQIFTGLPGTKYNYLYQPDFRGVIVLVNDQANFLIKNSGVLNSGTYSKIMISKTVADLIPYPYGSCVNKDQANTRLAVEMRRFNFTYSRKNCNTCFVNKNKSSIKLTVMT